MSSRSIFKNPDHLILYTHSVLPSAAATSARAEGGVVSDVVMFDAATDGGAVLLQVTPSINASKRMPLFVE